MRIIFFVVFTLCFFFAACGDDDDSTDSGQPNDDANDDVNDDMDDDADDDLNDDNDDDNQDDDDTALPPFDGSLALNFQRVPPGNGFIVVVTATDASGGPADDLNLSITSSRGVVGLITNFGDGSYECAITPDEEGSGEYMVAASSGEATVNRTALVLRYVGDRWNQPQMIGDPVSTPAWEDSVAITPNGQWLFVMYITVPLDCAFTGWNRDDPLCRTAIGPWAAPARPDMFGANRISSDGTIHHGCPTTGLDPMPFAVPPMALYGFHREADGVFGDPFVVGYEGMDGCGAPYGPTFLPPDQEQATMVFAYDDPHDLEDPEDMGSDLYAVDLTLGQKTILGKYRKVEGEVVMKDFLTERLGLDPRGHQGNPHLYYDESGAVKQIWIDDESVADEDRQIYAYILNGEFPTGPWSDRLILPSPLNSDGVEEIQPIFDGHEAIVRRGDDIVSFSFGGTDIFDTLSWGNEAVELSPEGWSGMEVGSIITLGEPTKAAVDGREELYFVYAVIANDGTLNLNVGWVPEAEER